MPVYAPRADGVRGHNRRSGLAASSSIGADAVCPLPVCPVKGGLRALPWLAAALFFYFLASTSAFTLRSTVISRDGREPHSVELPWKAPRAGSFVLKGTFVPRAWSSSVVRIIPDARMVTVFVGGRQVEPVQVRGEIGDWQQGVDLDLASVLGPGENEVEFHIANTLGTFGNIEVLASPVGVEARAALLAAVSMLSACIAFWLILAAVGMSVPIRALLCTSLFAQLLYFSWTGPYERTSDVYGHLAYVECIREEGSLPQPKGCWECHQPPVYYVLASIVEDAAEAAGLPGKRVLQLLSVSFALVFVVYAARTLGLFLESMTVLAAMTALVAFFPSQLLHAPRLGNDSLLYATSAIGFFHLCRWWRGDRRRNDADYYAALAIGLLALNVKTNAIVMIALQGILHLWAMVSDGLRGAASLRDQGWWRREVLRGAAAAGLVVLALLLSFSRSILGRTSPDSAQPATGVTASAQASESLSIEDRINRILDRDNPDGIDEGQRVGSGWRNFLGFDFASYVEVPYANMYDDRTGRQQVLPFLARTALFGEFRQQEAWALPVARAMAVSMLMVLAWSLAGLLWSLAPARLDSLLPASAGLVLFAAAIVLFRWAVPFASSGHWRFIVPVIVPMAVLMGSCWQGLRQEGTRRLVVDALLATFVAGFCTLTVAYWTLPALSFVYR